LIFSGRWFEFVFVASCIVPVLRVFFFFAAAVQHKSSQGQLIIVTLLTINIECVIAVVLIFSGGWLQFVLLLGRIFLVLGFLEPRYSATLSETFNICSLVFFELVSMLKIAKNVKRVLSSQGWVRMGRKQRERAKGTQVITGLIRTAINLQLDIHGFSSDHAVTGTKGT
jgi:hypothetical protein